MIPVAPIRIPTIRTVAERNPENFAQRNPAKFADLSEEETDLIETLRAKKAKMG